MVQQKDFIKQLENNYGICIEGIIENVKHYMPNFNEQKFVKAYAFAATAHQGQFRRDNTPYISHPVETVRILSSLHADEETLIAALLHDVPEDTENTIEDISEKFGKKVAFLVEGITKLAKVHYQHDMAMRQVDSLKRLFIHTAEDPRIILIKLADRLHNMRTLQYISKSQKQIRIARETLEIFVPIANLLGIEELKCELEDLCFRFLFPEEYQNLSERMQASKDKNQAMMNDTITLMEEEFKKRKLVATIYGRQKSIYRIYKKIIRDEKRIDEFDDIISLRILVQGIDDCYKALGILHSIFKPRPGLFKDYIAVPKSNGYQSLHTTVFGINGTTTEFQLRTNQMHLEAEHGIAANFFYDKDEKNKRKIIEDDKRAYWAEKIRQMQRNEQMDSQFMEELKSDVFSNRMFVFTPKGDSIDLPHEATAIDFAYSIHSEVGHKALKADINGKIVPMASVLKNGDTVRVITSDDLAKGPDRRWLAFAKTNSARDKIKEYLRRISYSEKLQIGKDLLQSEFDRAGLGLIQDIQNKKLKAYCAKNNYVSINDVFLAVGEGSLRTLDFINDICEEKDKGTATLGFFKFMERPFKDEQAHSYTPVLIKIVSKDAVGQLQDILAVTSEAGVNIKKTTAFISFWSKDFICRLLLAAENFTQVSDLCRNLEQVDGVKRVERLFWQRKMMFFFGSILMLSIWAFHPFLVNYLTSKFPFSIDPLVYNLAVYGGLMVLFLMIIVLKNLTQRSFPTFRHKKIYSIFTYFFAVFALGTLTAEIFFFKLQFSWFLLIGLILSITAYFLHQSFSNPEKRGS